MSDALHKPHDGLFQWTFSNLDRARAEFSAILPPALQRHLDLSTLALCSIGTADKKFQRFEVDLLYSAELCGKVAYVYLIFEHQSTVDALMPLRLLGRILRVLEWHVDQNGRSSSALPLPVVLPMVLTHGETRWTAATRFESLFDAALVSDPAIAAFVPRFTFLLDDLNVVSDDQLALRTRDLVAALALWALRDGRRSFPRLEASFRYWAEAMVALAGQGPYGLEALHRIFSYLLGVNDELTPDHFDRLVRHLPPETKDVIMTLAEKYEARGEAKGMAKGEAKGMAKGVAKGQAELLMRQLTLKFGELPEGVQRRIEGASAAELVRWGERVLTAESLSVVFAG